MEQPPKTETKEKPEPVSEEESRKFLEFHFELSNEDEFSDLCVETADRLKKMFGKERVMRSFLYHKLLGSTVGEKPFEEITFESEPEVDRAVIETFEDVTGADKRIKKLKEFKALLDKIHSENEPLSYHQNFTLAVTRELEKRFSRKELDESFLYHQLIYSMPRKETTLKSSPEIDEVVFETAKKMARQLEQEKSK